jgi:hypothetical protein
VSRLKGRKTIQIINQENTDIMKTNPNIENTPSFGKGSLHQTSEKPAIVAPLGRRRCLLRLLGAVLLPAILLMTGTCRADENSDLSGTWLITSGPNRGTILTASSIQQGFASFQTADRRGIQVRLENASGVTSMQGPTALGNTGGGSLSSDENTIFWTDRSGNVVAVWVRQ